MLPVLRKSKLSNKLFFILNSCTFTYFEIVQHFSFSRKFFFSHSVDPYHFKLSVAVRKNQSRNRWSL